MTSMPLRDPVAIDKVVARLAESRPAYAAILSFYGPVFLAQARAAADTAPTPIGADEAAMQMRQREGFALIEPASFTVDLEAAEHLLAVICGLAVAAGEKLGAAGKALASAMAEGAAMEDLFLDVLDEKGRLQSLAEKKDVRPDMLSLLLYLAIRPSIEKGARQLAVCQTGDSVLRSNCPICGSAPILGELDADGKQWVHCSLCWHRWPVERMVCLFCDNRSSDALTYLYSETEPEYRINLCEGCKQYLKVVDTRKLDRGFYPPLEQVASLHLDMLARDRGFTHFLDAGGSAVGVQPSSAQE